MKPLLPLAVLLAVMIAGCSKSDPYAKYRDVQLKRGMKIADIKQRFGEPDSFREWDSSSTQSAVHPYQPFDSSITFAPATTTHGEVLKYGAFGAHDQKRGHVTKYRLSMTFVDGELKDWEKSTPIDGE